jgi:hypothetical protein
MKRTLSLLLVTVAIAGSTVRMLGQASEIPSAAPAQPAGQNEEQMGKKLLDEMVEALGGQAWLDRKYMQVAGRTAAFYRGAPNGMVVEYQGWRRFAATGQPAAERIGFLTDKSMILPGKKIDVVQIYINDTAYEVTYKGRKELPKDLVIEYERRQKHSLENVMSQWVKTPGVMILFEGQTMVERKIADKVTVLSPDNDAVTIELDARSHLPLRRTFKWRNEKFKDFDEDAETYDDYHAVDGLPTPYTLTRYHNGDMQNQRFYTKVAYNMDLSPDLFNPDKLLQKK